MEDILASIRRIIADDQHAGGARRRSQEPSAVEPPAVVAEPAADRDDVLDLAQFASSGAPGTDDRHRFAAEPPRAAPRESAPPGSDVAAAPDHGPGADGVEPAAHAAAADPYPTAGTYEADEESRSLSLLAPQMSESVMSAFEALAATVVLENKPMLERILRDLMRPMLKTWLDDNLPGLVERLVRLEIERVARGGR